MSRLLIATVFCCFCCYFQAFSQTITSAGSGDWSTAATWSCNCVPTSVNSSQIRILSGHTVAITTTASAITASQVTVETGGTLILTGSGAGLFSPTSLIVQSGAIYDHNVTNGAAIPTATWQSGSTCQVTGWTSASASTTFQNSLTQSFHHFIWDCPNQTQANIQFAGKLTTVNGDLTINSTGAPTTTNRRITFGLSGMGTASCTVGGNFTLGPNTQLLLNVAGTYTLNVGGDVILNSTNTGSANAYTVQSSSSTAVTTVNVGRDLILNSGFLNMVSSSGTATVNVNRNFVLNGGSINKTGGGTANISFTGGGTHSYTRGTATFGVHSINYAVDAGNTLDLNTYGFGPITGNFTNSGTVIVRSTDNTDGAIAGNIVIQNRSFQPGSTVIYEGAAAQFMSFNQPSDAEVTTIINNANGVTLINDATIGGELILQDGNLNLDIWKLTLNGSLTANTNSLNITPASSLEIGGEGAFGVIPFSGGNTLANFTLNRTTSGTATLGDALTIAGTFEQVDGALELNGQTLTLEGDYNGNGSIVSTTGSSLVITNSGALPESAGITGVMNTLTLNRPGEQLNLGASSLTVTNLNLTEGSLNNTSALALASGGTITRTNGTMNTSPGGSTYNVVYNNAPDPIQSGPELHVVTSRVNNVTVAGDAEVTLSASRTINGDLTLASGGLNAGNFTLTLEGDLVVDAVSSFTASTLIFAGTTAMSGSVVPELGAVTVQSGATLTLPEDLSIGGTLTINTGATVNHNNGNVTLTGSHTSGAATQVVNANGVTLNNLTINKSVGTGAQLNSALQLIGTLSVESTNSALNSNGFLTLISTSDGTAGNARIAPLLNGTSVTGDVIAQRYLSSEGRVYRYLSSPVTNATVAMLQDDFPVTGQFTGTSPCTGCSTSQSLFYYDAAQGKYIGYPTNATGGTAAVLAPARGYSAFVRQDVLPGAVTVDVTGPVNQGDIVFPVVYNATVDGWNLVGNPYPSSINWDNVGGWDKTNIAGIAVRDNVENGGMFHYWNGSVGDLLGEIAAGQGFWVQATGASPSLTIHEQAKMTGAANWYRQGPVDALTMTLAKGTIKDKTYFQLHDEATVGQDALDVSKMANAYFDLSTRFASTGPMAINAVNNMTCGSELLLDLRFTKDSNGKFILAPAGSYDISFVMEGQKLSRYMITLVDQYTGVEQIITDNGTISFSITSDAASYASDRFKLVFGARTPDLALQTEGAASVCSDQEASLVIAGSQVGFEYYLKSSDNTALSATSTGNGGDLALTVSGSALKAGENTIYVGVKGFCGESTLAATWQIAHDEVGVPAVVSGIHCQPGVVELSATGAGAAGDYRWYETADETTPVATGAKFTTPELPKSKTYYAAIITASGCEGARQPVLAEIVQYNDAEITATAGDVLTSNFESGNQWYLDQELISGATGQTITASKSGVYAVEVSVGGCLTTDELEYVVTGNEAEVVATVSGYPNPAWKEINVSLRGSVQEIQTVDITNVTGQPVGQVTLAGSAKEKTGQLNVEQLLQGIYFVKIQLPAKTLVFKFMKQ